MKNKNNTLNTVVFALFMLATFCEGRAKSGSTWTSLYKKMFTEEELDENVEKNELYFSKLGIPGFSQLLFSWNAFRPTRGYFTFSVKARDAKSGTWGPWHKMIDWGADVQRSYISKTAKRTSYFHVRLEIPSSSRADGFRIKIVSNNAADMSQIKAFAVSVSDFSNFKSEVGDKRLLNLPSVYIENVPQLSQMVLDHPRSDGLCSPTSCSMLTSFLCKQAVDPVDFADKVFDSGLDTYGSWPFNIAHAFERCEGSMLFATARLDSFSSLHKQLRRGIPALVSVRGALDGAPKVYTNGHLIIVVGWDGETGQVICHDPAFDDNDATLQRYDIKNFLHAWEKSRRLIYLAEPFPEKYF